MSGGDPVRVEVRVPDIGDFEDVEVVEILVAAGDRVQVEDSLVSIESDKATMEIPSPHAGSVADLAVKLGDKVSEGALLLTLDVVEATPPAGDEPPSAPGAADEAAVQPARSEPDEALLQSVREEPAESPKPPQRAAGDPPPSRPPISPSPAAPGPVPHASPGVRKAARELGVDLSKAPGSGPHGRILETDVKGYVRAAMSGAGAPAQPVRGSDIDFGAFGEVEVRPLTRIQKVSARRLSASWPQLPQVTQHDEADITDLEAFRERHKTLSEERGVKLTFLPFLAKAVAAVLRRHPLLRSSLDASGEGLVIKHYFHIGIAVDTENGLVVPVVRDVDRKGVIEIAAEAAELAGRARNRKLAPADLEGACFTISSLGGIGGGHFTPIVNPPEVGILGVGRAALRPVWREGEGEGGGEFVPRRMLPFSLSYDHRVIDGAEAARFTTALSQALGGIAELLL